MTDDDRGTTSKPVGPFDDFDACVRHFEDDPEVDDPEALCGWMEQNKELAEQYDPQDGGILEFVDSLKDSEAQQILLDLGVTYVSGVENPAQDSQWVFAKDEDRPDADWGVTTPIVLHESQTVSVDGGARAPMWADKDGDDDAESEEQKAWAPVLIPNEADKQGDVIPAPEIEKAAHEFLAKYRKIDTDHDLLEGKGVPVESWTLKEAQTFTMPDGSESREYPAGTWMLGVEFTDDAWDRIKSGELQGFSIYGEAEAIDVEQLLDGVDAEPDPTKADGADSGAITAATEQLDALAASATGLSKAAESLDPTMPDDDNPDEGESADVADTLESIKETVESTKESVESQADRLDDLESRVSDVETVADAFEKDDDDGNVVIDDDSVVFELGEPEAEGGEGDGDDEAKEDDDDDEEDVEDENGGADEQDLAEAVADLLGVPVSDVMDAFGELKGEPSKAADEDADLDGDTIREQVKAALDELSDDEEEDVVLRKGQFEAHKGGQNDSVTVEFTEEDAKEAMPR